MKVLVTYKKIKYCHLRVKDGTICISAPFNASKERINKMINDNMDFINKQLAKQQQKAQENSLISCGQNIQILNNSYQIVATIGKIKVTEHFIFVLENNDIKGQIKILFKQQLWEYMYNLTKKYFQLMNYSCPFPKIVIKDVKSKWGSYDKIKHEIIYSSNILFKPLKVYDYLVVHELAHIKEFNHSNKFYQIVVKYCPNYKTLRKELRG